MGFLLSWAGPVIYVALALVALYGVFCVILLVRKIAQKRFSSASAAEQFLDDVRASLEKRDFEAVAELCDSPRYWSKATPQLILVALANKERGPHKLRQLLAEKFERDVLADLEYRFSWVGTIVKTAPMLGLLGTVSGMVLAFDKIAEAARQGTLDPSQLSKQISLALITTMCGLLVAIPLTILGSMVQVRMGKLTDSVQEHVSEFLNDLESAMKS
ncbi:MAG: MotA/TolQ/ExbB proton channel family protein [Planctomycetota bacterium]|nr:MAG: MotA/TolQ/ExbB proton channel family protein [Planctomycetota bacterium]